MTPVKSLDGNPYSGNLHVRFEEEEIALKATPRREHPLYDTKRAQSARKRMAFKASAVCAAVFATSSLLANPDFSWKCDGGVVTVPAGEATITDDDIADVQNLTAIVLVDAASLVTAQGLSSALNLSASVSGPGSLSFTSCAGVTVSGDNSALGGGFVFSDTPVVVTSRHGLGGENTPCATFVKGGNGTLSFAGHGLTNDVPLHITGEIDLPYGTDDLFVQRGDIILTGDKIWFRNVEVERGLVGNTSYSFFLTVRPDCRVTLRPDVSVRAGSSGGGLLYFMGELNKPLTGVIRLETGAIDARAGLHHFNYVDALELGVKDTFAETVQLQVSMNNNMDGGLDLCGKDQSFAYIFPNSAESPTSIKCQTVRSAAPATLEFTDTTAREISIPLKFSGAASFRYAGNGSYTLINQMSDTTGDLTVSSGTVALDWNAGWGSGDVIVDGGTLVCISPRSVSSGTGDLVVSGTGHLAVSNGVTLKVASARLGAVDLPKGVEYTKSDLDALGCGTYFDGAGMIAVAHDGTEFVWPDAPGGTVNIPIDTEVCLTTAEDAAKVMLYSKIKLQSGSRIVASELPGDFLLSAKVSGDGEFVMECITNVVLSGDNSGFAGGFTFKDCAVVVSNRYGLGGAATRYADFTSGTASSLTFGGGGLTNDVPLHITSDMTIPFDTDEEFVQRADILVSGDNFFTRNVYLESGVLDSGRYLLDVRPTAGHVFRAGAAATLKANAIIYLIGQYTAKQPTHAIRLEGASLSCSGEIYFFNYSVGLEFGAENAWNTAKPLGAALSTVGDGGIDLRGYSQTMPVVYPYQYTPSKGGRERLTVHSDSPAVLLFNDTTERTTVTPFKFTGAAGFTYAGNGSCTIINHVSDTFGHLTVSSGTVTFDWGAGWGGTNVTVGANGTLSITADSSGVGLYNENGVRRNTLVVENGGTLDLAENVCVTSYQAKVCGKWLGKGVYGGPAAGLDVAHTLGAITGAGRLVVRSTHGAGMIMIFR